MRVGLLYGSTHGRTRQVVGRALRRLAVQPDVVDVREDPGAERLGAWDRLLFFAPTYGDEELQPDMEAFVMRLPLDLTGRLFAICELGNYYGYDDYSMGAMPILRRRLLELGGRELCTPLSLDSMPRVDWPQLNRWIDQLNPLLDGHVGP